MCKYPNMNKGWLELESDPGLFTLLMEDFGVKGVQVEEIYDLTKPMEGPVYGFIFLFRWIEERRSRRKANPEVESFVTDDDAVNSIFFAQQIIPNSCATHALLSVLLNSNKVHLGETLTRVKDFTKHMNPEDKGYAIGNMPDLARAHNSHARPEPKQLPEKQSGISTVRTMDSESFHFVSYVPINGHLFELDGLKPYPIDHGPWDKTEDWTEKFRRVITERLGIATSGEPYHDIRFNLMVVVPDKQQLYEQKLNTLKTNHKIVLQAMQQVSNDQNSDDDSGFAETTLDDTSCSSIISDSTTQSLQQKSSQESSPASLPDCLTSSTSARDSRSDDISQCRSSSIDSVSMKTESDSSSTEASQLSTLEPSETADVLLEEKVKQECLTDVTTPLTIETKFSGSSSSGPSSECTDTASEVGSGFSSPGSSQSSPHLLGDGDDTSSKDGGERKRKRHRSSHRAFTPKDLLDLLKNVENEIDISGAILMEEAEKRKKYRIDDCRRTHNYDAFVTTFLTMLAEQGHLAELVNDNLMLQRKSGNAPARTKHTSPSSNSTPRSITKTPTPPTPARRRARAKRRR